MTIDINELRKDKRPQSSIVVQALLDRLETAENDAAHQKALAASALRVAEGWERKCGELRAKIEAMEKQVPICRAEDLRHAEILLPSLGLMPEDKLYALPGAQTQPAPSIPDGFSREDLEAVADGLDGYEKTVNVGNVTGEGDDHLESTTAYAARFIRTMLAATPETKP